jgi:hypothetical protein
MRVNEPLTRNAFVSLYSQNRRADSIERTKKARARPGTGGRVRKEQPSCAILASSRGEPDRGGEFRPAI